MLSDGVLISVLTKCGEWVVYPETVTYHKFVELYKSRAKGQDKYSYFFLDWLKYMLTFATTEFETDLNLAYSFSSVSTCSCCRGYNVVYNSRVLPSGQCQLIPSWFNKLNWIYSYFHYLLA